MNLLNKNLEKDREEKFEKFYLKYKLTLFKNIPKNKLFLIYNVGRADGAKFQNKNKVFNN